jgi:REP-associated tyrosine transposase
MRQTKMVFRTWGGKRKGAGRKPVGKQAGVAHRPREFAKGHPQHVTVRVMKDVPRLRNRRVWQVLQWALAMMLRREDFRICQASLQGNHLHLLVEADSREAFARGMQGFLISMAKQLNRRISRKGRVFADRYHARELKNPLMVKNALNYVLNNWRHHDEGGGTYDPFSSGVSFNGWKHRGQVLRLGHHELIPVSLAHTWLLSRGWRRHGELSPYARPGPEGE